MHERSGTRTATPSTPGSAAPASSSATSRRSARGCCRWCTRDRGSTGCWPAARRATPVSASTKTSGTPGAGAAMFQLFFSRVVMGRLGRDPEFFAHVEGSVATRILQRTRHALTVLNPADNPYIHWILRGTHGDGVAAGAARRALRDDSRSSRPARRGGRATSPPRSTTSATARCMAATSATSSSTCRSTRRAGSSNACAARWPRAAGWPTGTCWRRDRGPTSWPGSCGR